MKNKNLPVLFAAFLLLGVYVLNISGPVQASDTPVLKPNVPTVDLSGMKDHHVIVADGVKDKEYYGHPTTTLSADGKTMFACPMMPPHKGRARLILISHDAGLTWEKLPRDITPGFQRHRNCGMLYALKDPETGKERIHCIGGWSGMPRIMSEDGGKTWKDMPGLGYACVVPVTSIVELPDKTHLGVYHLGDGGGDQKRSLIQQIRSKDGGLTWTGPRAIATTPPYSKGGKQICKATNVLALFHTRIVHDRKRGYSTLPGVETQNV